MNRFENMCWDIFVVCGVFVIPAFLVTIYYFPASADESNAEYFMATLEHFPDVFEKIQVKQGHDGRKQIIFIYWKEKDRNWKAIDFPNDEKGKKIVAKARLHKNFEFKKPGDTLGKGLPKEGRVSMAIAAIFACIAVISLFIALVPRSK